MLLWRSGTLRFTIAGRTSPRRRRTTAICSYPVSRRLPDSHRVLRTQRLSVSRLENVSLPAGRSPVAGWWYGVSG
jgi:hypothetical protein